MKKNIKELTEIKGCKEKEEDKILSVEELLSCLNRIFSFIGEVKVRGEIIEVNAHPNGYCFFTIKDSQTKEHSVNCYISRWGFDSFSYLIEIGMEVIVSAIPSVYKNGRFSLTVNKIEPYGKGALKRAFEILKKKLEAKGYFNPSRKRPIPEFIQKIGLITSESGAAIRDFKKNLGEYGFKIYFIDVRVEGDYAEQSIVSAINQFNKDLPELDILVLTRGGGGLEELKAFNSEKVGEAIALSRIPVVTGIGHERDETIADYCADKSFSTPSSAALFIKRQREQLIDRIEIYPQTLISLIDNLFNETKNCVLKKKEELESVFFIVLEQYRLLLSKLESTILHFVYNREEIVRNQLHKIDIIIHKCLNLLKGRFDLEKSRLKTAEAALLSLNPEAVLKRGYSIAYTSDNRVLKQVKDIKVGESIFVKLYRGKIHSRVEKTEN